MTIGWLTATLGITASLLAVPVSEVYQPADRPALFSSRSNASPKTIAIAAPMPQRSARPWLQPIQFDDDSDGVAGCVNACKLDLEICLNTRPDGEPPDRCEKLEDDCENKCYND
jgi:hypothetical protein